MLLRGDAGELVDHHPAVEAIVRLAESGYPDEAELQLPLPRVRDVLAARPDLRARYEQAIGRPAIPPADAVP